MDNSRVIYGLDLAGAHEWWAEDFGEIGWRFCERGQLPMLGNGLSVVKHLAEPIFKGRITLIKGGISSSGKQYYLPLDAMGGTDQYRKGQYTGFHTWAPHLFRDLS